MEQDLEYRDVRVIIELVRQIKTKLIMVYGDYREVQWNLEKK